MQLAAPPLILASQSPRRAELLRALPVRFQVVPALGVEELLSGRPPAVLAMDNARAKAGAVADQHPAALALGADTIVVRAGAVFGKPTDRADAERMLRELAGGPHEVMTGVCLAHRALDTEITFCETTRVWMKALGAAEIGAYLDAIDPLDKAGAYAIQDSGDLIIERIEGSYSNVMGLPMERIRGTLEKLGLLPAHDTP